MDKNKRNKAPSRFDPTAAQRAARYRQRKRLAHLNEDWVRRELLSYYESHQIPADCWVLAVDFYTGSAVVQSLIPVDLFLSTTMGKAGTKFVGFEAQQLTLNGDMTWIIRPKGMK